MTETPQEPLNTGSPSPESADATLRIAPIQEHIAQAALKLATEKRLDRGTLDDLLLRSLLVSPEDYPAVEKLMEKRGLLPHALTGQRHIEGLTESQQNVLQSPDGLFLQCTRLAHSAQEVGKYLGMTPDEIKHVTVAAVLLNSGKAAQMAGLAFDLEAFKDLPEENKAIAVLHGYNEREAADYNSIAVAGISEGAVNILRENVRHDPSALKTPTGKLLYYLLYCQMPDTGELVPVEQRVNSSIHKHSVYGQLYKGYAAEHDGQDLVVVHQQTVAAIESEITAALQAKSHRFTDLKSYLNEVLK